MIWCKRVNPLLPVQLVLLMRKKGLLLRRATIPPADFSVKRVAEPLWEGGEGRGREGRKGGGKRRKKEGKRKGREGREGEGRKRTYVPTGVTMVPYSLYTYPLSTRQFPAPNTGLSLASFSNSCNQVPQITHNSSKLPTRTLGACVASHCSLTSHCNPMVVCSDACKPCAWLLGRLAGICWTVCRTG